MDLFLVVYFAGQVGALAGPLPGDLASCLAFAEERRERYAQAVASGVLEPDLLQFSCQFLQTSPTTEKDA